MSLTQVNENFLYKLIVSDIENKTVEYAKSSPVFSVIRKAIIAYLKLCQRIISTFYWLFAPNMLLKLAMRHIFLFMIMFAIPPIIRFSVKPFWRFLRYRIILRIVMGAEWVHKYAQIKRECSKQTLAYKEYAVFGSKLDEMEGYDAWRISKSSNLYSYNRIQQDLIELARFRRKCDEHASMSNLREISDMHHPMRDLMEFLRSRIERNYCGIANAELYSVTTIGTKKLIEDFIDNICQSLHYIASAETSGISLQEKIVYFQELRHVLGRTALCLSGGGALGIYHAGLVVSLAENKLLPKIITGASAGSVVAAFACTNHEDQYHDLCQNMNLKIYHEKERRSWSTVVSVRCKRFWETGYFLDATVLRDYVKDNIGDITFLEAYQKTGKILNIAVSGSDANTMPRLLNFLTAPHVVIYSAVIASCAVPIIFEPQELYIKSPISGKIEPIYLEGARFNDGSMAHDLPMDKIATLFNVDNFIVSQVNPHLVPFLFHSVVAPIPLFEKLFRFLGKEFQLYLSTILVNVGGIRFVNDMLTQKYTGDVTMVPDIPRRDLFRVLTNPTQKYIDRVSNVGRKSTFKHISRLQGLCAAEFTIDECFKKLKAKYSESNKDGASNTMNRVSSFENPSKLLLQNMNEGNKNNQLRNDENVSANLESIIE